jgi:RNA polymerase sigma-70 factor, ECF subfamily
VVAYRFEQSGDVQTAGEQSWVKASQDGDVAAFNRLVLRWQSQVYNLACRMLNDADEAAEATQDVFLKAFRAIRSFRCDCHFSTWLYRIAANQCMTRLKKRRRLPSYSLDDEESRGHLGPQLPCQESHERRFMQEETGSQIRQALARLSPEQRLVVELKFFQELTFEEIAAVVEAPLSTVKSRLYQGLETLRKRLGSNK